MLNPQSLSKQKRPALRELRHELHTQCDCGFVQTLGNLGTLDRLLPWNHVAEATTTSPPVNDSHLPAKAGADHWTPDACLKKWLQDALHYTCTIYECTMHIYNISTGENNANANGTVKANVAKRANTMRAQT
jgi:hypothetical protein